MGEMLRLLFEAGISQSSLLECLSSILIHDDALKTIHLLHSKGIPQYIMSDANSIFIHTILKANKLENIFLPQNIFTNPAWWDNEKNNNILCVKYYHQDPHSCSLCPRNLCKGKVLKEEILSKDQKDNNSELKIIYFGDGGGDLCPIISIPNGIAMARTDYILHKKLFQRGFPILTYAFFKEISSNPTDTSKVSQSLTTTTTTTTDISPSSNSLQVFAWKNYSEMYTIIHSLNLMNEVRNKSKRKRSSKTDES